MSDTKQELVFRLFEAHEIQVRAGQTTKAGDKISLLLFQDARAAMNRLDEKFGEFGWQREHKEVNGAAYCGVSLWSKEHNCWVTKWDAGEASNPKTSPKKSEASDGFKRACVNWGIGRELYTAPRMYVPISTDTFGMTVQSIEYDEHRRITALTIADRNGNIIYQKDKNNSPKRAQTVSNTNPTQQVVEKVAQVNYESACREVEACQNRQEVINVFYKHEKTSYGQRLFDYAQEFLNRKGW